MNNKKSTNNKLTSKYSSNNYSDDDFINVASSQECTGLVAAAPANEDELENYNQIYRFLPIIENKTKK